MENPTLSREAPPGPVDAPRAERAAAPPRGEWRCQRVLTWLLALHVPLIVVEWALGGARGGLMLWAGLLVTCGALAASVTATLGQVARGVAVRVGLVVAVVTVLLASGISPLGRVPYLVVLAFVAVYVPLRMHRQDGDPEGQIQERLRELEEMKDQLVAVASHEFRTPLTGVMGFARTMSNHLEELDEDTLRLFVDSIEDHSQRLARLVDNLVATSRRPEPTLAASSDLHQVTAAVVSELDPAVREGNRLQVSLRGRLQAAIGEEAARRVVYNLLDNAVKFADPDTLVRLDARPQGGDLVIDVTNVGPPIPADLREHLYEPFVQGDSSDTRRADGLGIGLHVVRRLVEAHGGRVELLDGNGLVTFRVRLNPAAEPAGEWG